MDDLATHVFVVDDDSDMLESIAWILNSLGYSVHAFSSADEYLAAPICSVPCCLITDLLLPGMTGMESLSRDRVPPNALLLCHDLGLRRYPFGRGGDASWRD